jgi:biofilm PGA synthesis N-glycosyltransferase PgaC
MYERRYALITAAYNEGRFIGRTIESVLNQTVRPAQWIIVSDGSVDDTDAIVQRYARDHSFIGYFRMPDGHVRIPAAQIRAFNEGLRLVDDSNDFIGNVDADVEFPPTYFESLFQRFAANPKLGLAGGVVEDADVGFRKALRGEGLRTVCQAVQLFRWDCYKAIGGYPALRYGSSDTYMEVSARKLGWDVESYPDLRVAHNRPTASASGLLRGRLRQGRADFYIGTHPLFEIARCCRRLNDKPVGLASLLRLTAFFSLYLSGERPSAEDEFVQFYKKEQLKRLQAWFSLRASSPLR